MQPTRAVEQGKLLGSRETGHCRLGEFANGAFPASELPPHGDQPWLSASQPPQYFAMAFLLGTRKTFSNCKPAVRRIRFKLLTNKSSGLNSRGPQVYRESAFKSEKTAKNDFGVSCKVNSFKRKTPQTLAFVGVLVLAKEI